MRKTCLTLLSALLFLATANAATPLPGKALHDKQCIACHAKQFGGDGSKMYTRADHKIGTLAALHQRVAMCSAQTNAGWFPEDEANVAAWLNQQFYKFK